MKSYYKSCNVLFYALQLRTYGEYPGVGADVNYRFCIVSAPPVPPSKIAGVHVADRAVHRSDDRKASFVVQWSKPEYLNGDAEIGPTYQVWIGTVILPPKADLFHYHDEKLLLDSDIKVSGSVIWEMFVLDFL